jgi:hypothetical protein
MGLKMGVFFEMGGHKGPDLRGQSKRVNIRRPEGIFSRKFRNLRELFLKSSPTLSDFFTKT